MHSGLTETLHLTTIKRHAHIQTGRKINKINSQPDRERGGMGVGGDKENERDKQTNTQPARDRQRDRETETESKRINS